MESARKFSSFDRAHSDPAGGTRQGAWCRKSMVVLWAVVVLAGCAPHPQATTIAPDNTEFEEVFSRAYEGVYDKYIEPLDASDIAVRGIKGLSDLDPDWTAGRDGPALRVSLGGEPVGLLAFPAHDDVRGWADVTSHAIALGREASLRIRDADSEAIYRAVLRRALAPLDPHTRYVGLRSARDYRAQREGFGGIGIRLNFDGNEPRVISILHDTPAEASALKAGDTITHIDSDPVHGLPRREIIWRLRGEPGSPVRIRAIRKIASNPFEVVLRRALIVSPTVHLRRKGGLAVISISGFNQSTFRDLERILKVSVADAEPARGIVLDLRGNPGGLLDQAVAVADAFLAKGRIVSTRGRHPDSFQLFNATGRELAAGLPMVVLINGQSASAAEIVAAALQDRGRAVVVGSTSYGKGTVQNITRLPNDGELILTWARFHAPSGYALDRLGVMPNICTSPPWNPDVDSAATLEEKVVAATAVLSVWRNHLAADDAEAESLRTKCPPRAEISELDLKAAERILSDTTLYAQALGAITPSVARSGGAGAVGVHH